MIFHKALVRELANAALATFFVLLGITLTTQLVKLLGQAARGLITSTGVMALLGFTVVNYLPVLLSLTAFIAVLMTLTRSYRDSEMVVWFASGLPLTRWIRPVLVFALPFVFTIGLLSLVLSPWAVSKSEDLRRLMATRDEVSAIVPGVFRESSRSDRVYFVEEISGSENMVANVFVSGTQHQKLGVMVARRGFQETAENGDRFLVLLNGRRYEGEPGTADYRVYEFERYAMRVETGSSGARQPTSKSMSTLDLVREPSARNLSELSWRVGLPVSAFILALLAIPLSFVNPRAGRSMNLVIALLIYMSYSNIMSIAQAWIAQSRVSFAAALSIHLMMAVVLVAFFYRRLMVSFRLPFRA
jgi:lipopolysaccharide export system permease protein